MSASYDDLSQFLTHTMVGVLGGMLKAILNAAEMQRIADDLELLGA